MARKRPWWSVPSRVAIAVAASLAAGCAAEVESEPLASAESEVSTGIKVGALTVYLVRPTSGDVVDRAMAFDLAARRFHYMGPEDFRYAVDKPGYPFVLFTVRGLEAVPAEGTPLYEHELTHMAAAANVKRLTGRALAELMRPDGCAFTSRARFHEVCADWKRFVAPVYQSREKMRRLLDVLGADVPPYVRTDEFVGRLDTTGVDLVDAACLWDERAMEELERVLDERATSAGAFRALFPPHAHHGSCVEAHMDRARAELAPASAACRTIATSSLNVRRGPGVSHDAVGALSRGARVDMLEERAVGSATWLRVMPHGSMAEECSAQESDRACWVHGAYVAPCL